MPDPILPIMNVDRVLHEPSRLAILATLGACRSADFQFLLSITGMSKNNLSMQLAKLEEYRLIRIEKSFVKKKPRTDVSLTPSGKAALQKYKRLIQELLG